nr:hypothetical protein [Clavibacter michiganensis]
MIEATQEPTQKADAPGQLVGLITLTVLAFIAAVVLFIVGLVIGGDGSPNAREAAIQIGLAWWSGFLLTVAVVAFIGVLVLAGVRRLLSTAGFRV